ncbi:MAG TPA: TIGR00725 family protein [Acidothermaceae bacterium]
MAARRVAVAVVGPADADEALREIAYAAGKLLAQRGAVVMTGGLGGVMAAASQGARESGGLVVGLLPTSDSADANEFVDVVIPTGLGELRNGLLVRCADGVIAVGGSWGTLSEIALAMRTGTPVVCLRGWEISDQAGARVNLVNATSAADAIDVLYRALPLAKDLPTLSS